MLSLMWEQYHRALNLSAFSVTTLNGNKFIQPVIESCNHMKEEHDGFEKRTIVNLYLGKNYILSDDMVQFLFPIRGNSDTQLSCLEECIWVLDVKHRSNMNIYKQPG